MRTLTRCTPWSVACAVLSLAFLTSCGQRTRTPTSPDNGIILLSAPASSGCQAKRLYWQEFLADTTRMCASARNEDIPEDESVNLLTNTWVFRVPELSERFPNSEISINFDLVGWRFTNECGAEGPEVQMDMKAAFLVNAGGKHLNVFTVQGQYNLLPNTTIDPAHPWSFAYRHEGPKLFRSVNFELIQTRFSEFNTSGLFDLMEKIVTGVSCAIRPRFAPS